MADDDELDEEALMNNTLGAVVVPNSGAAAAADFARSHDEAQLARGGRGRQRAQAPP